MNKALLLGTGLALLSFGAHAADLAIEAKPVAAAPSTSSYSGYVSVNGQGTSWDYWDDDYNPWKGLGAEAALAYQLDSNWQIEAELTTWSAIDSYEGYVSPYGTVAALHANYSLGDASIGAFGGVHVHNNYYDDYGTEYDGIIGVEGQVSVTDNLVLDGQVGYTKNFAGYDVNDYPVSAGFAQARAKFFPLDNLELSAYVGLIKGGMNYSGYDFSALTYGAEVEYQFEDTPFSVFAAYEGFKEDTNWDMSANTVKIGARFSFDGESLKDQAKTGASHNVANLSPISWLRLDW